MDKKNKNPNVPNLRFSSFTNSYCVYTLGEILQRVSNPVNIDENKLYYQIGIRSHSKGIFYKKAETGKQIGNKKIFWVESNCLILNIVFAWEQAVAKTSQKEIGMVVSHRFPMYKVLNNSLDYIVDFFKTEKGRQVLQMASPGGAGRNKTLNQKFFLNSKVYLPSLKEQLIISRFIALIENRIETQIKIINDYYSLKKAIIQHIFNASAQYSKVHLDIILKEISKKNKEQIHNNGLSVSNSLGFVKQSEQFVDREIASSDTSNYKIVNKNEYAYNPARINVGSIARLTNYDCGIVSPMYTVFEINTTRIIYEYFDYFLHSFTFQKQLNQRLEGSVRQCLTFNSMKNIEIELPPIEVQIEISKNMKHLDSKIKIESDYLNLLKSQKNYLLKNMFT